MVHKSKNHQLQTKAMIIYKNDIRITYTNPYKGKKGKHAEKEGKKEVYELSRKSLQNLAFYAQNTAVKFLSFVTLTYPREYPADGKIIKGHLNRFLSWLRGKWGGVQYLWFLEFQKRGAPHFHVMVSVDLTGHKADISKRWYDAVGSGDDRHLRAGTNTQKLKSVDGCARYVSKYASKKEQKYVPEGYRNVGAFWGSSRGVKPEPVKEYRIEGMVGEDLIKFFGELGWPYAESLTKPLSILYNAATLINT